jgi:hypothetical protein
MLFVMFFLVKDGERIWAWLLGALRTDTARRVDLAGHAAAWLAVVYYMRGTVAVAAIHAIVVGVVRAAGRAAGGGRAGHPGHAGHQGLGWTRVPESGDWCGHAGPYGHRPQGSSPRVKGDGPGNGAEHSGRAGPPGGSPAPGLVSRGWLRAWRGG